MMKFKRWAAGIMTAVMVAGNTGAGLAEAPEALTDPILLEEDTSSEEDFVIDDVPETDGSYPDFAGDEADVPSDILIEEETEEVSAEELPSDDGLWEDGWLVDISAEEDDLLSESADTDVQPDEAGVQDLDSAKEQNLEPEETDNGEPGAASEEAEDAEDADRTGTLVPGAEEEAAAEMASDEKQISLNAEKIELYYLPSVYQGKGITIPENCPQSFQIEVTGSTQKPRYTEAGSGAGEIDENGLVTLSGDSDTSSLFRIYVEDCVFELEVISVNYGTVYAKKVMQDYVDSFPADWSDYQKLTEIVRYTAEEHAYDYYYSSAVSMVIMGGGDCWASTDMIVTMCEMTGLNARGRNASQDGGAGGGHMNALIEIDGEIYIADAGYSSIGENGKRNWTLNRMTMLFDRDWGDEENAVHIRQYNGFETDVVIPEELAGQRVVAINDAAFYRSGIQITSVVIPNTVETIGEKAFYGMSLETVTIPASVTSIGLNAFGGMETLKEFVVDPLNPVYSSRNGMLYNKEGTELLNVPSGLTGTVVIPDGTVSIEEYALYESSISSAVLPESLEEIKERAFEKSRLEELTLPESLRRIGSYAFYNSWLEVLTIPAGVEQIDRYGLQDPNELIFLADHAVLGENAIYWRCKVAGHAGSAIDHYIAENELGIFFPLGEHDRPALQEEWFDISSLSGRTRTFDGSAQEPGIYFQTEIYNGLGLRKDFNYTVSYENNVHTGTAAAVVSGLGMFSGSELRFPFTIEPYHLFSPYYDSDDVTILGDGSHENERDYDFNGESVCPTVLVEGYTEGQDYIVTYADNDTPGRAYLTLTGIGDYNGTSGRYYYDIYGKFPEASAFSVSDVVFNGEAQTPEVTVPGLVNGEDYYCSYENNEHAGTATVTVTGSRWRPGQAEISFQIIPAELPEITQKIEDQIYDGEAVEPWIYVPCLTGGTDYTVTYLNNDRVGTGTAVITGIGDYRGTRQVTFNITGKTEETEEETEKQTEEETEKQTEEETEKQTEEETGKQTEEETEKQTEEETEKQTEEATEGQTEEETEGQTETEDPRIDFSKVFVYLDFGDYCRYDGGYVYGYTGMAIRPSVYAEVLLSDGGKTQWVYLKQGTDYDLSYKNNLKEGTGTAVLTGKGRYKGTKSVKFIIRKGAHDYGSWVTTKAATFKAKGSKKRTCRGCGYVHKAEIPQLVPKLSVSTKPLSIAKTKSKTLTVAITKPDKLTVKSSNVKIVTASYSTKTGKLTIKALKKPGKAVVALTTGTGLKKQITVTVPCIAAKKLTCTRKSVTVKKGKTFTLKPSCTPALSDITYTSANKKIATVSAAGVIKGIRKGTTSVTIKSGKITVKMKVIVK